MSRKKPRPLVELPIKYEKTRQILEFPLYKVKDGEAIIVRTKKNIGLSEQCFVVSNNKGKIEITPVKERK